MSRSSSRPLRSTGPAFLLSGASQEREVRSGDPNSFQWLWRIPRLAPAILCGSDGAALARPGQCICRREPAGRRRVWAGMARGGPSGKQRTWDDFIAFAEDLIRRKVTSPRRLGVVGGSQGGLLLGTATTQRRDRFNAAIVQVALFDMFRFTKLGASSSYIGEYGDPAIPSSAGGSRPTHPIRSLSRARPTQSSSFSLPSRTTACIRPTAARQPPGLLRSASPITAMRISTADIARPPISRDARAGGSRIHLCIQAACGLSAVDE